MIHYHKNITGVTSTKIFVSPVTLSINDSLRVVINGKVSNNPTSQDMQIIIILLLFFFLLLLLCNTYKNIGLKKIGNLQEIIERIIDLEPSENRIDKIVESEIRKDKIIKTKQKKNRKRKETIKNGLIINKTKELEETELKLMSLKERIK